MSGAEYFEQEEEPATVEAVPEVTILPAEPGPEWEEAGIRNKLRMLGGGLHVLVARGHETAWLMTQQDLDGIAPPLTRILNRHEITRGVAAASDPIDLLIATGIYTLRSVLQAAAAASEAKEEELEGRQEAAAVEGHVVHANGSQPEEAEWIRPKFR